MSGDERSGNPRLGWGDDDPDQVKDVTDRFAGRGWGDDDPIRPPGTPPGLFGGVAPGSEAAGPLPAPEPDGDSWGDGDP